jgi:hypothetical protein
MSNSKFNKIRSFSTPSVFVPSTVSKAVSLVNTPLSPLLMMESTVHIMTTQAEADNAGNTSMKTYAIGTEALPLNCKILYITVKESTLTPGETNSYRFGLSTTVGEAIHTYGHLLNLGNALSSLSTDFVHILDNDNDPFPVTAYPYPVIEVKDLHPDNALNDSGSIKVNILCICP